MAIRPYAALDRWPHNESTRIKRPFKGYVTIRVGLALVETKLEATLGRRDLAKSVLLWVVCLFTFVSDREIQEDFDGPAPNIPWLATLPLTPRPACGEWTSSEIMDAFGDIHS
jgi:hypothetical protein